MSALNFLNKETSKWDAIPALKGDPGEQGEPGADGKSAYVTTVNATLYAEDWKSTPATQRVYVSDVTTDAEGDIGLAPTATAEQVTAAASAMLLATSQGEGVVIVTAFGTVPTIDIPIIVRVVRVG